jgi:WD40 repeat protein
VDASPGGPPEKAAEPKSPESKSPEPQQSEPEVPPPPAVDPTKTYATTGWKTESPLIACRFDPTGRFLLAAAQDSSIQRFDVASGQHVPLVGHESWVRGMAFDPTGRWLYAGDYAGRLLWWDLTAETPTATHTIDAHEGWIRAVAVNAAGTQIATCGNDHKVRLHAAEGGSLIQELAGHEHHVYNVLFHPGGQDLVSVDLKGVVKHWDLKTGELKRDLDAAKLWKYDTGFRADIGGARCIAFNADGSQLALGGITEVSNAFAGVGRPAVVVLDWAKGEEVQFHKAKETTRGTTWGLNFHPEGFLVGAAGGGSGGYLYFWRPDKDVEFHQLKLPDSSRDSDLHPNGLDVAVAHYDGHVRIYRMAEKPPEPPPPAEEKPEEKA